MRCVSERSGFRIITEWPTSSIRLTSAHACRDALCTDRKRAPCNCFACNRFHTYVYDRELVNVKTDHKPLEPIFTRPLPIAPKRLQRMLLKLQQYIPSVRYKKGKDLHLADTLSRAYLPEVNACESTRELEEIDHRALMPVREETWHQLKNAAADDPVKHTLRSGI